MFEPGTPDEIVRRISSLTPATQHVWGKMHVAQMLAHCCTAMEVATGKRVAKRLLIGRLIGPLIQEEILR